MYIDFYYIVLVVPALLLSLICQAVVSSAFSKYGKVSSGRRMTGADAACEMLRRNGVDNVVIERVSGRLTDHYDSRTHTLRLSESVYGQSSVAAIGVAAHEAGHALQHAESYGPLALRSTLVPAANIGSTVGPWLAMIGLFLSSGWLVTAGILLFSVAVVFYVVTLPVEFNASRRALGALENYDILSPTEMSGAKAVLRAAAMTYVAAALVAVANLLRFILRARGSNRN